MSGLLIGMYGCTKWKIWFSLEMDKNLGEKGGRFLWMCIGYKAEA